MADLERLTEEEWRQRFTLTSTDVDALEVRSNRRREDSGQPRDKIGRFAHTGSHVDAHVAHASESARDLARAYGQSPEAAHEEGKAEGNRVRQAHDNAQRARDAGDVHEPPREKLDHLHDIREHTADRVGAARHDLDKRQQEAVHEMDKLRRFEDEMSSSNLSHDHASMLEASDQLAATEHGLRGRPHGNGKEYQRLLHEPHESHEDPGDYEPLESGTPAEHRAHRQEHDAAVAEYQQATAASGKAFREQALTTQIAMERAHAQQLKTTAELKGAEKTHAKARREAEREIEDIDGRDLIASHFDKHRNEDGDIEAPAMIDREHVAVKAAETMLSHQRNHIDRLDLDTDDARSALGEAARDTARTIRELSKITKRAYRAAPAADR